MTVGDDCGREATDEQGGTSTVWLPARSRPPLSGTDGRMLTMMRPWTIASDTFGGGVGATEVFALIVVGVVCVAAPTGVVVLAWLAYTGSLQDSYARWVARRGHKG